VLLATGTADGRPPLIMIGQPMDATAFRALARFFPDRTVVTYDPRGAGRSIRKDGRVEQTPQDQARDVHAVIAAVGGGPVEMFASSGGAVVALALVAAFPRDVTVLVAHEPPMNTAGIRASTSRTPRNPRKATGSQGTCSPSRVVAAVGRDHGADGVPATEDDRGPGGQPHRLSAAQMRVDRAQVQHGGGRGGDGDDLDDRDQPQVTRQIVHNTLLI
jgi:pimeloyl-ACP methyl ester carboxylesterase